MAKQKGLLRIAGVKKWKQFMENTRAGFTDATVYESNITYATDAIARSFLMRLASRLRQPLFFLCDFAMRPWGEAHWDKDATPEALKHLPLKKRGPSSRGHAS